MKLSTSVRLLLLCSQAILRAFCNHALHTCPKVNCVVPGCQAGVGTGLLAVWAGQRGALQCTRSFIDPYSGCRCLGDLSTDSGATCHNMLFCHISAEVATLEQGGSLLTAPSHTGARAGLAALWLHQARGHQKTLLRPAQAAGAV